MNVTLVNKSRIPTSELQGMVEWLSTCYGDVNMPVRLTVVSKNNRVGVWGKAYWPTQKETRRVIKKGEYSIKIFVGLPRTSWPHTVCYKKRAGSLTVHNEAEYLFWVLAHEMRHVEQFDACRRAVAAKHPMFAALPAVYLNYFSMTFKVWERAKYASGSCEVDAELVAHPLVRAWHDSKEISVQQKLAA